MEREYIKTISAMTERERSILLRCILDYNDYDQTCRFMLDEGLTPPTREVFRNFRNQPDVKENLRCVWEDASHNRELSPVFQLETLTRMANLARVNFERASTNIESAMDSTHYMKQYLASLEAAKGLRDHTEKIYAYGVENIEARQAMQLEQMQKDLLVMIAKQLGMTIKNDAIILEDGTEIPLDISKLVGVPQIEPA